MCSEKAIVKICDLILSNNLNSSGINRIIDALKFKKYIVSATVPESIENETFEHFLERFWNYEKSPYVAEKRVAGQSIHHRYVDIMLKRCRHYWIPRYGKKLVCEITLQDVKNNLQYLATKPQLVGTVKKDFSGKQVFEKRMLKPETVNQIVRGVALALKWAYYNGLTKNNCFKGIVWCHVVPKKRLIPTISQTNKIFSAQWKNKSACLANLISVCTGMRIGEIQALQLKDIGKDRIYVRHNWAKGEGLKSPKNGFEREILINESLMKIIVEYARKNPYGQNPSNFLFWGQNKSCPRPAAQWNASLHEVAKNLHIKQANDLTFHCWRHFFATNMADNVDLRKLQLATGHKSLEILEHYAKHESERTLTELGEISDRIFSPIVKCCRLIQ